MSANDHEALKALIGRVLDAQYTFEGDLDDCVDDNLTDAILTAGFRRPRVVETEANTEWKHCTEGVTRRGIFEPCDLPAVAVRIDPEFDEPYPVCKRHVRGNMVPIVELFTPSDETED